LLLYLDPYEFEALNGQGIDKAVIRQNLPNSLRARIEVTPLPSEETEAVARFRKMIERADPAWIYLSPAHPLDPAAVARQYPGIRFFYEDPYGNSSENRIALVYDREQANREAGRAVASLLGDSEFLERIGASGGGTENTRVGILVAVNNEIIQRDIAAFTEGFSLLSDPQRIEIKEIGNFTDRVKARRLLDGMKEENVVIVLLKTYVLSGFCLDYLAKESVPAVVEGPVSDQAYGDTVLLMLVDDFIGALGKMAGYIERQTGTGAEENLTAPVRLRWNGSYQSLVDRILQ
jgi:basic membrane lipoprotein Med (substrate-binding protein (PBP1-ABC) superfamily)